MENRMDEVTSKMAACETNMNLVGHRITSCEASVRGTGPPGLLPKYERKMMECKTIVFLASLTGEKAAFRKWNQKFKAAVYGTNKKYGEML